MIKIAIKRWLPLLLAVLMMVSVVPFQVAAAETEVYAETEVSEQELTTEEVLNESQIVRLKEAKAQMDAILQKYLGATVVPQADIENTVLGMDDDSLMEAWDESQAYVDYVETMTDAEIHFLTLYESYETFAYFYDTMYMLFNPAVSMLAAKTNNVLDGKVSVTDSSGNGSLSGNTVTVKAAGSLFSKATNNITITNETDVTANVSFDYSAVTYNSFSIAGATASASGTYTAVLDAGATISITLVSNSGLSNRTATLTLSNFSYTEAKSTSKVTVNFDSSLGSVTVGGTSATSGSAHDVTLADGTQLVATVNTGSKFLGWINAETRYILSTATTYNYIPTEDVTIEAVFAVNNGTPWFMIGGAAQKSVSSGMLNLSKTYYYTVSSGSYLYDDFNTATEAAAASSNAKAVVLMNDAILPAGDYTIPAGVTVLIPFDSDNTMYTTEAVSVADANYVSPTAYRTLTLADGANITVNGSMSISAQHKVAAGSKLNGGSPSGNVAFVKMNGNSNITVNNGGALYAYGFITGSGSIVANSGASVYENFQIMDFRGGTQSTDMENGVFPLSQYYIQNIEVPLTLHSGSKEYAYTTIAMSGYNFGSAVAFIAGSDAMFNLTSGYVVKRYDGTKDRLIVEAYGDLTFSSINMTVGTSSINSKNYELPINSNLSVYVKNGANITINQDMAMLPGSEIVIEEGSACTLGSGINIYVYDADEWGTYVFGPVINGVDNYKVQPLTYAPGRTYTRTEADLVDAKIIVNGTVDATKGFVYTTAGGADISSSGNGVVKMAIGTQTVTHQLVQNVGYNEIPITPAKLKNADGTYVESQKTSGHVTYSKDTGLWNCVHSYTETIIEAGCETTGAIINACACGDSYSVELPATGHTEVADAAVAPTCTETGLTAGKHCSVCSAVLEAQQVVPETGHTLGADADCTNAQTCTVCGEELAAALGHDYNDTVIAPTCTDAGYTAHTCTRCGDSYNDSEVAATGHTPGAEATCTAAQTCTVCSVELAPIKAHTIGESASCTTAGTCSVCGKVLEEALGHNYEATVTDPTCTADGYTTYTCTRCDDSYVDDAVAALGHTEAVDEAVAPTCTATGLTAGTHCSVCDEVLVAQEVVAALGHDYAATVTDPTCTENGYTTNNCTRCDDSYIDAIVAATGHTPGAEPTCTEAQTCTVCGTELAAATGHTIVNMPAKTPTYTEDGWAEYEVCENCDYSTFAGFIPALGGEPEITTYDDFLFNLGLLEEIAAEYVKLNPSKDPLALVIKYIRTGVDRYNSGSWGIMAGYEDADFAKFVIDMEAEVNSQVTDGNYIKVTGLKNIENFNIPNGDYVDFGHMFGAMDITYHNKGSVNHADVSGWAGDLVDLMEASDIGGVNGTLDEMIKEISTNYLGKSGYTPSMNTTDIYGDFDAFYIMETLYATEYKTSVLAEIVGNYFTSSLTDEDRADFFLNNRLETTGTITHIRNAVYNTYIGNKMITTLEGTREFSRTDLSDLRKATCYAFADYLCKLAGDYVEVAENRYYEVFESSSSTLAPGIIQEAYRATSADNEQMVYYVATADITRDDVHLFANYNNCDPSTWAMARVLDQANAAQSKYGDPESPDYIKDYNVIVSTNADGYNMTTGEPGGLLIMDGKEWHAIDGGGFFGITKDGKAVIGTQDEYNNTYKDQLKDAVGGFGTRLIIDGKIATVPTDTYYTDRAPRTAVGITKTGKVVLMVLDGRQQPYSCGGSMEEIAQIMFEAGCVDAINLDGGGSSTFVAKLQGEEELAVLNSPSDGAPRSVSTSLLMVSTAPSSTAFDHANLESDYSYSTIGTPVQITPVGISATGNVTDLPEGYTWAVSDERWGSITEDGVFTGLRNGSVDVYLMLDGAVIGSKTMNIIVPENVYFTRDTMDGIYGSETDLPVAALYQGKAVAISTSDVTLTMDNSAAGTINGFTFTATEGTGIKVVKITIAWAGEGEVLGDTIAVNLYRQGENSFDFDKATGGDRLLAYDRVVSNSTTSDNVTYVAEDTDKDMVTSYVFAMDMTQIPIPEQLSDLIYMLPGADMENATAWNFLLQLAERISTLSEVTPVIYFDPNFDVDYSELEIKNDYFELESAEFDEATNSLTMRLRWIDQTAAIDPATANPICLVKGIKLTPKDTAAWDANNRLNAVHTGSISYKIYMRANALYSFAQKEENQIMYGLQPFVNPDDPSETGGYFGTNFKDFEDSYTLINAPKNGWYAEDNGFAYYIEGVRMAGGVKKAGGYYYLFDNKGINIGQTKYTGIFRDDEDGVYRFAKAGVIANGWQSVDGNWYYFDTTTNAAVSGQQKIGGVKYEFEANGKLISGTWVNIFTGWRYYYGPTYYVSKWQQIDGNWYYFRNGVRVTGQSEVSAPDNVMLRRWYEFDENGVSQGTITGIIENEGALYWCQDGVLTERGMFELNGDYYCSKHDGSLAVNEKYYVWKVDPNCDLPVGHYDFGPDGKALGVGSDANVGGIVNKDGKLYYYENGKPVEKGLIKIGEDYYYVDFDGSLIVNQRYYAWKLDASSELPTGHYEFGADGKMLDGIVEKDGALYYYENGVGVEKGLFMQDGNYYCAKSGGALAVNEKYYVWKFDSECAGVLPVDHYHFDENGKLLLDGIVTKNGVLYYYENGKPKEMGLFEYEGGYYFSNYDGSLVVDQKYYAWKINSNCDLPVDHYHFDENGRMLFSGIVTRDGVLYYYENGKPKEKGLFKIGDDYYYIQYDGSLIVNQKYYAWKLGDNCDLPVDHYEFDENGKMLQGIVDKNGVLYYYENGKPKEKGLFKIGEDYYYIQYDGTLIVNQKYYAWKLGVNCDLPVDHYEFDENGKMVQGIVDKDGVLYYYENGKPKEKGFFKIGDDYYYVQYDGTLIVNQKYYAWKLNENCDLPVGHYEFDENGKMRNGIVEKDGELYYYINGAPSKEGLFMLDGYYYYSLPNGKLVTNQVYHIWKGNDLLFEKTYTFNELGQIIG